MASVYYPPASFQFAVRVAGAGGEVDASFAEVSGLSSERSVTELREGGENRFVHRLPGPQKSGNLVLKRGLMAAGSALYRWSKDSLEGDFAQPLQPRSLTVSLLDAKGRALMTWAVAGAWPVKWSVAAFDAAKSEVAMETLELAFTTLERKLNRTLPQSGTFAPT